MEKVMPVGPDDSRVS